MQSFFFFQSNLLLVFVKLCFYSCYFFALVFSPVLLDVEADQIKVKDSVKYLVRRGEGWLARSQFFGLASFPRREVDRCTMLEYRKYNGKKTLRAFLDQSNTRVGSHLPGSRGVQYPACEGNEKSVAGV